jgi:hypothetical protein
MIIIIIIVIVSCGTLVVGLLGHVKEIPPACKSSITYFGEGNHLTW